MKFEELQRAVRRKHFSPLYLFYGREDFLIEESIKLVVRNALEAGVEGFNLDVLYGGETDARTVISIALSFPMMSERRVVVLKETEKLLRPKAERELLTSYIAKPSPTTCLILVATDADLRENPYAAINRTGVVVKCQPLFDSDVPTWIARRIRELGKEITPEACRMIHAYVGNSLRNIENEIQKLFIYVGAKQRIDEDDITSVVGASKLFNIFELTKAVGDKNLKCAFEIMARMLQAGESPIMMITMLTRHFSALWKLTVLKPKQKSANDDIAALVQIPRRLVPEYLAQVDNYPASKIEKCFQYLVEADETLKTTATDPKVVMSLLIHKLIKY